VSKYDGTVGVGTDGELVFKWQAVPHATGYLITFNGGLYFDVKGYGVFPDYNSGSGVTLTTDGNYVILTISGSINGSYSGGVAAHSEEMANDKATSLYKNSEYTPLPQPN